MAKLTKRVVDALQAKAGGYFPWDSQIAGFGLRVMPSGAKTYQAQTHQRGHGTSRQEREPCLEYLTTPQSSHGCRALRTRL